MDLIGDISQVYIVNKIYLLNIAFAIRLAIKAPAAAASIRSVGPKQRDRFTQSGALRGARSVSRK